MLTTILYGLFVSYELTEATTTRRLLQNYPPPPPNHGATPIYYAPTMPGMNLPQNPPAVLYPVYSGQSTTTAAPVNPFFGVPATTQPVTSSTQPPVAATTASAVVNSASQNPFFPSASTTTTTTTTAPASSSASPITTQPALQIPTYPVPAPAQTELECVVAQGMFGSCANTIQTPTNIANQWKLKCAALGACYGTTLNLQLGQYGQTSSTPTYGGITELYGLWFTEQNSGAYATLNLYNFQGGSALKVQRIECGDMGSCYNTKFNLYNVDIGDFVCSPLSACQGCTITDWTNPNAPITTTCLEIA